MNLIDPSRQEIMDWVMNKRHVRSRMVSNEFGITGHKAGQILREMERNGLLECIDHTVRRILYRVKK